jgi:hypothetical protein
MLVSRSGDPGAVGAWLLENARYMSEAMFFQPGAPWRELAPFHVLALRAVAPDAFTPTAKGAYLTLVSGDPTLTEIAHALFSSDTGFLSRAPANLYPQLTQLMQMAKIARRSQA